ncbi:alpha/beta fold hydrolase [soil metagenome]
MNYAKLRTRYVGTHCRLIALLAASVIAGFCFPPQVRADDAKPVSNKQIDGNWLGTLRVGAIEMRLLFRIKKGDDGKLTASGESIDQGTKDLVIETVTFADNILTLKMPGMQATFIGKLLPDGDTIKGELEKGDKLPLELKRQTKEFTLTRPQLPSKPYPYLEDEITFPSKAKDVTLAGTFTRPKGKGPFVTVVLISGSGPQDRDEAVMGHKPFLVLADHLTRHGIAVLRYDDRGIAKSTGDFKTATSRDFADDTSGAVTYLKARPDVGKIGLIGHSEGGIIAPMVATEGSDVAFLVLLAGQGTPGDVVMLAQGQLIVKAMGGDEKTMARQKSLQQKLFAVAKENDAAKKKLAVVDLEDGLSIAEKAAVRAQMTMVTGPWFTYFLSYDPRPTLGKVKCPILALNGDKDLQVPARENLAEIARAAQAGGNLDVTVKELPGLNHLFQPAKTGLPFEYGKIETTFDPQALEIISNWIAQRTGAGR